MTQPVHPLYDDDPIVEVHFFFHFHVLINSNHLSIVNSQEQIKFAKSMLEFLSTEGLSLNIVSDLIYYYLLLIFLPFLKQITVLNRKLSAF